MLYREKIIKIIKIKNKCSYKVEGYNLAENKT